MLHAKGDSGTQLHGSEHKTGFRTKWDALVSFTACIKVFKDKRINTVFNFISSYIYKYFFLNHHGLIHVSHTHTHTLKQNYTCKVLSPKFLLQIKDTQNIKYISQAADIRMAERVNSLVDSMCNPCLETTLVKTYSIQIL